MQTSAVSSERVAAAAIGIGYVSGMMVMVLHPTGSDVVHAASAGAANAMVTAVHWVAMIGQALVLAGLLGVTMRLQQARSVAIGAYVFMALGTFAVIIAAASSGLVVPGVLRGLAGADETRRTAMMGAANYTGIVNQAFARVYVVFSAIAILGWSWAIFRGREMTRPLSYYGFVVGPALIIGVLSGQLRLDIHGFGAVVLSEGAWMVWAARQLWQSAQE